MSGLFANQSSSSLPRQLADLLREEVLAIALANPEGGGRLPTEKQWSLKHKVSERTLREAIGFLAHDGLVERRHGSGMYTGDLRRCQHVAILVSPLFDRAPGQTFSYQLCQHVMAILERAGRRCRWYWPIQDQSRKYQVAGFESHDLVSDLRRGLVWGVVAVTVNSHRDWLTLCERQGLPVVGTSPRFPCRLELDHAQGVRAGVDHLVSCGAKRLGLLAWTDPQDDRRHGPPWRTLFRNALSAHGLEYQPAWVADDHHPEKPGAGWEGFRELWTHGPLKPDGLLVCDDVLYRDAATAIVEAGLRVPEQLRVATLCNKGIPMFHPFPAALLEMDVEACGQAMCDKLLQPVREGLSADSPRPVPFALRHSQGSTPPATVRSKTSSGASRR